MLHRNHAFHDAEELFRGWAERHSVFLMLLVWVLIIGATFAAMIFNDAAL